MKRLFFLLTILGTSALAGPSWDAPPEAQGPGQFWRLHWYEPGLTNGNPILNSRFRVNSPEAALTPGFAQRSEVRGNGMMLIRTEQEPLQLQVAELYLELWGGHPGTGNKRVTVNGRSTYALPRVGTDEGHCTYDYPAIALKSSDLVRGYNAIQFAVDQGSTFWGHCIVDNACLRVAITNRDPEIEANGLSHFIAQVRADRSAATEEFNLRLHASGAQQAEITRVDYQAWYYGYDENGNTRPRDWHGFTKNKQPVAFAATAIAPPFEGRWNTRMLPEQKELRFRALIQFASRPGLVYVTAPSDSFEVPARSNTKVIMYSAHDLPVPFWSRAGKLRQCTIDLDIEPARIESAELHVVAWAGGPGKVQDYFRLNGVHYPVADGERHDLVYSRLPVKPEHLKHGVNSIELLSDTDHHGIEICLPGPALVVRARTTP